MGFMVVGNVGGQTDQKILSKLFGNMKHVSLSGRRRRALAATEVKMGKCRKFPSPTRPYSITHMRLH